MPGIGPETHIFSRYGPVLPVLGAPPFHCILALLSPTFWRTYHGVITVTVTCLQCWHIARPDTYSLKACKLSLGTARNFFLTFCTKKSRLLTTVYIIGPFRSVILKRCKKWSKRDTTLIFFSSESWDFILFNDVTWGTIGGLGEALFYFELCGKLQIFIFSHILQTKIDTPQVPRWSPKLHIWKVWNLSFHWKKKLMS